MHQNLVENLKSQLKYYNVDPFEDISAIFISTGLEISFSVPQDLLQASQLSNKKYLNFVKERLGEEGKSIFESISKSYIKPNNEKKNPDENNVSSEKDKQALGVIAAKPADLHEAFSYPVTSLSLSIACPDYSLYQSDKAGFRNYIMTLANSISFSFLQIAKWSLK